MTPVRTRIFSLSITLLVLSLLLLLALLLLAHMNTAHPPGPLVMFHQ